MSTRSVTAVRILLTLVTLFLCSLLWMRWVPTSLAVEEATGAMGIRRSLYPSQWGIDRPAGLTYSSELQQFFLIDKSRSQRKGATIVTVTPYEQVMTQIPIDLDMGDAGNLVFDDTYRRLLLLSRNERMLIQIPLGDNGQLNPAGMQQVAIGQLPLNSVKGMAIDTAQQRLYFLNQGRRQIISVPLNAKLEIAATDTVSIDIRAATAGLVQGLAVHPTTGHLFVGNPNQQRMQELATDGSLVKSYLTEALALNDLQSFVFAPSADLTDAPTTIHLFVADSYQPGAQVAGEPAGEETEETTSALTNRIYLPLISAQSTAGTDTDAPTAPEGATDSAVGANRLGEIKEVALDWSADAVNAAAAPIVLPLVQTIHTSLFTPPGPDPAGIAFVPPLNRLFITDSEVNEMPIFGGNFFETTVGGTVIRAGSTLTFSDEPTGVAYNPNNGHLFVSDDDAQRIYEVRTGSDGLFGTTDDLVTSFNTAIFNSLDPEGVAYDPAANVLYIADGINAEVYRVAPGPNELFDGIAAAGGDDLVTNFDVQSLIIYDPEGIDYDPATDHLFLVGNNRARIYEITTDGQLVQLYDTGVANIIKNGGIGLAPGSTNPAAMNFYVVDRGIDNNADPSENDGVLYEFGRPGSGATPTPTATPTDLPQPTATATPTPTAPPTATPTATPVSTGACPAGAFLLDRFNSTSYNNNDGSINWSGSWSESADNGSPFSGRIRITSGALRLSDYPNSGQIPSITRQADLSGTGGATLSFSYDTPFTVDSTDQVRIRISNNGGSSWTTLQTFAGRTSGTASYNISAYRSANTLIRFEVNQQYNIWNEYFAVDNLRISCTN